MSKNSFATKLQYLLKQSAIKNATLAKAVQYDLSYISKWLSGKMLPSEKNIDEVIENIVSALMKSDYSKLLEEYHCDEKTLPNYLITDLHRAYEACRPNKSEDRFQITQPLTEIVQLIDQKIWDSERVLSILDILSLPHENRLILAGIKNGYFTEKPQNIEYSMVITISLDDCVYDSIFLIHMLTSMSDINFNLYNNKTAMGKIIYCIDEQSVSAFLFPGNKDCVAVNECLNGTKMKQSIIPFIDQENLIFRKTTISEMIVHRDYIQTMISTNIRWILGHATELLLPQDVFLELLAEDDRDTSEYCRLYNLSQNVLKTDTSQIMIYESAITNLVVDGIIDFYNKPVKLKPIQVLKCLNYYNNLLREKCQIKLIDGGFSEDFRYITNPCMFLSDSLCYIRLENNHYENNILILNDRTAKKMFELFFATVWSNRTDIVSDDKRQITEKISRYHDLTEILLTI